MARPIKSLVGERHGHLVVKSTGARNARGKATWNCQCDCGGMSVVTTGNLKRTHRCGAKCGFRVREAHGHGSPGKSPTYQSWLAMKNRCHGNPSESTKNYGDRGIVVCDRWRHSFENFLGDMGPRPEGTFIERIDSNGNYELGNCKWATRKEQNRNKRNSHLFTFYGKTRTLAEWREISQVPQATISRRIAEGWSEKDAVWKPSRPMRRTLATNS